MKKLICFALVSTAVVAIVKCCKKAHKGDCCFFENKGKAIDSALDKACKKAKKGAEDLKNVWENSKEDMHDNDDFSTSNSTY